MKPLQRFFTRDLFATMALVIFSMAGVAWFSAWQTNRELQRMRLQEAIHRLSADLGALTKGVEHLADTVGHLWQVGIIDPSRPAEMERTLTAFLEESEDVQGLAVLTPSGEGILLRSAGEGIQRAPLTRQDASQNSAPDPFARGGWFSLVQQTQRAQWGQMEWFPGDARPGMAYLHPVFRDQHLIGVVRVELPLQRLATRAWEHSPGSISQMLLTDELDRILVRPKPSDTRDPAWADFGRPLSERSLPVFHAAYRKSREGQSLIRVLQGDQPFQVLKAPLTHHPSQKWQLAIAIPDQGVWGQTPALHVFLLILSGTVLASLVAWRMALLLRRLRTPLRQLHEAACDMEAGRIPSPPQTPIEEFHTLGEAIVRAAHAAKRERDIQAQLETSERLRIMGSLAGGIAHDINNQLAAIIGQLNLGKGHLPEEHPTLTRIVRAEEAVNRCSQMIRSFLGFGRRDDAVMGPLDLNELIHQTSLFIERVMGGTIQVRLELGTDLPRIHGSLVDLEQMLLNLCVNARDAMPAGGTLTLTTQRVSAQLTLLAVADTGRGMEAHVVPHVFEPFFTTKEVGKGTGLGLTMVQGIVENHHGRIELDTALGRGTTVRIYLPTRHGPQPTGAEGLPVQAEGTRASLEGFRILVAEDEPNLRELLVDALTREQAEVDAASDGAQAWALWSSHPYDLLVTDHRMPHLTGVDLVHRIRACSPSTPIILTTGFGLDGRETEFEEDPFLRILPKPFSLHRLFQVAEALLRSQASTPGR